MTDDVITLFPEDFKNQKPRTVPLTERAKAIIEKKGKKPFKEINSDQANRAFRWARKGLEINDPEFCLHACRHTFASRILETGADGGHRKKKPAGCHSPGSCIKPANTPGIHQRHPGPTSKIIVA
ncbi:MAG: hypothetical protein U5L07_16640 [Desulfobacterales bacterium]|nr:hypothetical protein [Desulfobacterales bacterium]